MAAGRSDNANGDTYGPVNYYAYVPARAIFGWSGSWDDLPAAHAAAIAFDLLTLLGLYFLGRRIRGPTLGVVLAYAWAAYPFTLYVLSSNSNDSLVALLVVLALLVITSAPGRGGAGRARGVHEVRAAGARAAAVARRRAVAAQASLCSRSSIAFAATVGGRDAPGADPSTTCTRSGTTRSPTRPAAARRSRSGACGAGLDFEQHLVQGAAVGAGRWWSRSCPRRRDVVEVAALGAAVLIALQLGMTHWFYLYIVWFFPLVMVALLGASRSGRAR